MFGIGTNELVLILIFGFIVFGPDKLPAMAKTIGQAIARFRRARNSMTDVIKNEVFDPTADDPFKNPLDAMARLEKKAQGERAEESFSERKARYDRQREAQRRNEERKAELAARKAEAKARMESDPSANGAAPAATADGEHHPEAAAVAASPKKPAISVDELYGIAPLDSSAAAHDARVQEDPARLEANDQKGE